MPIRSIIKPDVIDDPDPITAPPSASRIFPVSFFMLNGAAASRQIFKSRALAVAPSSDAPSASNAVFDAQLWVDVDGSWVKEGDVVARVLSNRLVSASLGAIGGVTYDGFLQLFNIAASPDAVGFEQVLYDADGPSFAEPRTASGLPKVALAPIASWYTYPNVSPPTGAAPPASITGGDSVPVEQFVLLQSDPGNTDTIEIMDSTAPVGRGFVLSKGQSVEWRVPNASTIYSHAAAVGQVLHVTIF